MTLLLSTFPAQQKALLDTASHEQVDLISEVVHNIVNVVPLPHGERKSLSRRKYLKDISNIKRSVKHRKSIIRDNKKKLLDLLATYSPQLKLTLSAL